MNKMTSGSEKTKTQNVLPPSTLTEDRQSFIINADSKTHPLPQYFDRENWETFHTFKVRVSHIYDPSKFWMVVKEREVQIFQNYLYDFYSKYGEHYVIPEFQRQLFLYCIACSDGVYYRGIIINIPHFIHRAPLALVFCIDFGFIVPVELHHLYIFTKNMYSVPQFAVRASLSDVAPLNLLEWRKQDYQAFFNLVNGKLLACAISYVDKKRKVLGVNLAEYDDVLKTVTNISDSLLEQQVAVKMTYADLAKLDSTDEKINEKQQYVVKLPFNLPPIEAIEWGLAPSSLIAYEALKEYLQ